MATVVARKGESGEQLLRRFRKQVQRAKILTTVRRKRWYSKPSDIRRLKRRKAVRRQRRRQRKWQRRQSRRRY
jgi:small subunit ribosomal protein S21